MTDDQTPAGLTAIEVRIPVAAPVSPDEADTLANIAAEAVRRLVQRGGPVDAEAHTVDVGHVHVLAEPGGPGGPCAPGCPHPDHQTRGALMACTRRYRKKPVVVEAAGPITVDNVADIARWADADYWGPESPMPAIFVETLEGEMRADLGDWIIRGVQGEFYPCKPDIFASTYEPVEDDQ